MQLAENKLLRKPEAISEPALSLAWERTDDVQALMLERVSRTFALTIPYLPERLRRVVSNAYLLCRMLDTIEDEPTLQDSQKREFCDLFVRVVAEEGDAASFADRLTPLLSKQTHPWEQELIARTPWIINITRGFAADDQRAIARCVKRMAEGMMEFAGRAHTAGLTDFAETDRYCYFVAGIVGEMLTQLFCLHSPGIRRNHSRLVSLSASFGKGLQMTNILKDIWEDRARGVCWLPREIFGECEGDHLSELSEQERLQKGLLRIMGIAHAHLKNALHYVLLIPRQEAGIRKFCFSSVIMALLTLRRIRNRPDFKSGADVKISRRSVKMTLWGTELFAHSDIFLRILFYLVGFRLPIAPHQDSSDTGVSKICSEAC